MADNEVAQESLIYDECQELSVGERDGWVESIMRAFPAFQSVNYRYYFTGQLISLIGTWLQVVAEGWLVLQLTNSAFWVGTVAALATLPSLFLAPFGGVIVDRFPKKNILYVTQLAAMILALMYGFLTVFHLISIWEIATLAFLLGVVNAVDIPARQAFVVELVDKDALSSAIALNSGVFNGARVVGPSIAGLLIALIGSGGAFILNGVSYIAAIIALWLLNLQETPRQIHTNPFIAIKNGFVYAFSHSTIRNLLIFTGIVSIFGWSYSAIMPYIAKNIFGLGASGLGYFYAATGLGALTGTIIISALSKKISTAQFILGGTTIFTIALTLFTLTKSVSLGLLLLFFAGFGLIASFTTVNTTIQHLVDDTMRGRVLSLYALMFLGLSPIGNFEVGFVAEYLGSSVAIRIGSLIVLLTAYAMYFLSRRRLQDNN